MKHIFNDHFLAFSARSDSSVLNRNSNIVNLIAKTSGLPFITTFYVQAPFHLLNPSKFIADSVHEAILNNIYLNSFRGVTHAPKDPPSPFDKYNFLDTLKGYINQSRSLNWITNQSTADKYNLLLDSSKSKLLQN